MDDEHTWMKTALDGINTRIDNLEKSLVDLSKRMDEGFTRIHERIDSIQEGLSTHEKECAKKYDDFNERFTATEKQHTRWGYIAVAALTLLIASDHDGVDKVLKIIGLL